MPLCEVTPAGYANRANVKKGIEVGRSASRGYSIIPSILGMKCWRPFCRLPEVPPPPPVFGTSKHRFPTMVCHVIRFYVARNELFLNFHFSSRIKEKKVFFKISYESFSSRILNHVMSGAAKNVFKIVWNLSLGTLLSVTSIFGKSWNHGKNRLWK